MYSPNSLARKSAAYSKATHYSVTFLDNDHSVAQWNDSNLDVPSIRGGLTPMLRTPHHTQLTRVKRKAKKLQKVLDDFFHQNFHDLKTDKKNYGILNSTFAHKSNTINAYTCYKSDFCIVYRKTRKPPCSSDTYLHSQVNNYLIFPTLSPQDFRVDNYHVINHGN